MGQVILNVHVYAKQKINLTWANFSLFMVAGGES